MARPSRHIDRRLLDAGLELLPEVGLRDLSIRQLAEHAGVNLGMFHYHFGSKENYFAALLQHQYDLLIEGLAVETDRQARPVERLRAAVLEVARFARTHRKLLRQLLGDVMAGGDAAIGFMRRNEFRHVRMLSGLYDETVHAGELRDLPRLDALVTIAASVGAPILLAAGFEAAAEPAPALQSIVEHVLSDAGIEARLDIALRGLAPDVRSDSPPTTPRRRAGRKTAPGVA